MDTFGTTARITTDTIPQPVSTVASTTSTAVNPTTSSTPNTTTSFFDATQRSGAGSSSSSSSWTGTIVGVTIGVVASIGAGYLAYLKWRGHGKRGGGPGALGVAMNAIDHVHEDDLRMQANPVYEGTALQQAPRTYEQPHIDTWARDLYSTQESDSKAVATTYGTPIPVRGQSYVALQKGAVNLGQYESAHSALRPSTWNTQVYDTNNGEDRPPAYETLIAPQQPWNSVQYAISSAAETRRTGYYTIANPDQHQPWDEPSEFMGFPETSEL